MSNYKALAATNRIAFEEFCVAEDTWADLMRSHSGASERSWRYNAENQGAEGSELRRLYDTMEAKRVVWLASLDALDGWDSAKGCAS
jgi:hypothetical protein